MGEILADACRGIEMRQQRILASGARLPLPAPLVLTLLHYVGNQHHTLIWTPTTRHDIVTFGAALAICVNYAFFCRAESGARCQT
jgi:hypothetical protein